MHNARCVVTDDTIWRSILSVPVHQKYYSEISFVYVTANSLYSEEINQKTTAFLQYIIVDGVWNVC